MQSDKLTGGHETRDTAGSLFVGVNRKLSPVGVPRNLSLTSVIAIHPQLIESAITLFDPSHVLLTVATGDRQ
jgi:hypothetical protein